MNEESKKIDKEIEDTSNLSKEKQKNDLFLKNFEGDQKRYLYEVNKIEKKMKLLKLHHDCVTKDINIYKDESRN